MDSFQGTGTITLQHGSSNVPYRFQITVATSSTLNNGALPYGSTLHSFTVKAYQKGSTASSTYPIISKANSSNQMVLNLTWTTQINPGLYKLEFKIQASVNHSVVTPIKRQFEFDRLLLREKR